MSVVPVRWWQIVDYVRITLAMLRGHDPWADRIAARPWAPSSLLEYAYILFQFPSSDAYFLVGSDTRVGVLWIIERGDLAYMVNYGLLPAYRLCEAGVRVARLIMETMDFTERYVGDRGLEALVLRMAGSNTTSQRMAKIFGCRPLGLATTTLSLADPIPAGSSPAGVEVTPLSRRQAVRAWRRLKLAAVERVSGPAGVRVASRYVELFSWVDPPPRETGLAIWRGEREIGLAIARRRGKGLEVSLLAADGILSGDVTAVWAGAVAARLQRPVHHLTVTLGHADGLAASAPFRFTRSRREERLTMFQLAAWRPALAGAGADSGQSP